MSGVPAREAEIDVELVRRMLEDQHPDLAHLSLAEVAEGFDSVMFRLGEDLAVRVPRRGVSAGRLLNEQQWLPRLAPRLPIPIPAPVRVGLPGSGFPWPWSVTPWTPGATAGTTPIDPGETAVLGAFLRALHQPAPSEAPDNPYRGGALSDLRDSQTRRLATLASTAAVAPADVETAAVLLGELAAIPIDRSRQWIHGDLHPSNLVVEDGRITAVIDWIDITAGDPATDLSVLWAAFDPAHHDAFWTAYGDPGPATRMRAVGWAIHMALLWIVDVGELAPSLAAVGVTTLRRVLRSNAPTGTDC